MPNLLYHAYTTLFGHSDWINNIRNNRTNHNVHVSPSAQIGRRTQLLGDVDISDEVSISWFCTISGDIQIDKGTGLNGQNNIIGEVSIGKYCAIAPRARINTTSHQTKYASMQTGLNNSLNIDASSAGSEDPVYIGNDVWICADTKILGGVTIGDGAIVAANSVVVDDVEPYSFVAGNPAEHKKYRFNKETRKDLQNVQWWNWSKDKMKRNTKFFSTDLTNVDDVRSLIVE